MPDMLTIKEASKILNRGYLQTRIYLGDPDDCIITLNGRQKFLYTSDHVNKVKERLDIAQNAKLRNRGKRKCYYCNTLVPKEELTSGICTKCQAYKMVKNFACHGKYEDGDIDTDRLESVANALHSLQANIAQHPPQTVPTM